MIELDEGLTPAEERVVEQLGSLVVDPDPAVVAKIMATVQAAPWPEVRRGRGGFLGRLRLAAIGAVAAVLLTSTAVFASNDALPSQPTYQVRRIVERARIQVADPLEKERLRVSFAKARIRQAHDRLTNGNDARQLLSDGLAYLKEADANLGQVGANQQEQVRHELEQVEVQEGTVEQQLQQPVPASPDSSGSAPKQPDGAGRGGSSQPPAALPVEHSSSGSTPPAGSDGGGAQAAPQTTDSNPSQP